MGGGTSVVIYGSELAGATAVDFGTKPASSFSVNTGSGQITAISPPGTGTVDVTVTAPYGTSATSSADQFTYTPAVTEISPATGPASGGTVVVISGVGVNDATGVDFGTTPAASFSVNYYAQLTATSPPGTGTVDVTVTTPEGTFGQIRGRSVHVQPGGDEHVGIRLSQSVDVWPGGDLYGHGHEHDERQHGDAQRHRAVLRRHQSPGHRFGAERQRRSATSIFTTSALTVAGSPHSIEAVFTNATGTFATSNGTWSQTIGEVSTTTVVTLDQSSGSVYGQAVTFTATVADTAPAARRRPAARCSFTTAPISWPPVRP